MNNKQKHRLKKKLKRESPKLFWNIPLWKLFYKRTAGNLTPENVQRMKLLSDDAFREGRKELWLITKNWKNE